MSKSNNYGTEFEQLRHLADLLEQASADATNAADRLDAIRRYGHSRHYDDTQHVARVEAYYMRQIMAHIEVRWVDIAPCLTHGVAWQHCLCDTPPAQPWQLTTVDLPSSLTIGETADGTPITQTVVERY